MFTNFLQKETLFPERKIIKFETVQLWLIFRRRHKGAMRSTLMAFS